MSIERVTVFSASARPGLAQVRQLKQAGYEVRAVSRRPAGNPALDGVELVAADLGDADSLLRRCKGADAVFFTSPTFTDMSRSVEHARAVASAAVATGVERFVYNTTTWHPEEPTGVPTMDVHLLKTEAIRKTGVPATVVRPSLFMDNLLTRWLKPYIVDHHEFSYPHKPDLQVSWICLEDVACFMVAVLAHDDLVGETFDIGGPEQLRPQDVADLLSEAVGTDIAFRYITPRDFADRMFDIFADVCGVSREEYVRDLVQHYEFKNESNPFRLTMADVMARVPIRLTSMREWLARQDWTTSAEAEPIGSVSG